MLRKLDLRLSGSSKFFIVLISWHEVRYSRCQMLYHIARYLTGYHKNHGRWYRIHCKGLKVG